MAEILIPPVIKLGDHEKDICCFNGGGTICFEPPCGLPTQFVEWECQGSTDGCSGEEHTRWSEFNGYVCEGSTDGCSGEEHTRWSEFNGYVCQGSTDGCSGEEHTRWSEFAAWTCIGVGDTCASPTQQAAYDADAANGPGASGSGNIDVVVTGGSTGDPLTYRFAILSCCPVRIRVTVRYRCWDNNTQNFCQGSSERTVVATFFSPLGLHYQSAANTAWRPLPDGTWKVIDWSSVIDGQECSNSLQSKGRVEA
jgi:hypothetical protein